MNRPALAAILLLGLALLCASTCWATPVTFRFESSAQRVFLAGEFNNWSDSAQPMTQGEDGIWSVTLDLAPGDYQYKYVADGTWITDPHSVDTTDDGFGGKNSIVHVGKDAMTVGVGAAAGTAGAKAAAEGAEAVGGGKNAQGNAGVQAKAGQRLVHFGISAPGAGSVYLAGEFNGWNASGEKMEDPDGDGVFEVTLPLKPGRYQYKYVIDGTWKEDPASAEYADDGFGGKNSVVAVVAGDGVQEAAAGSGGAGPGGGAQGAAGTEGASGASGTTGGEAVHGTFSVTFSYQPVISGVGSVMLAGTFNDWNVGATPMTDPDGDGTYTATLLLPAGEYQYKFVVDGNWITDEKATAFADDGFGGKNSVITVDASYEKMDLEVGDGRIYLKGLEVVLDYPTVNAVDEGQLLLRAKAYRDDIQELRLHYRVGDGEPQTVPMLAAEKDPVFVTYRRPLEFTGDGDLRFTFEYRDANTHRFATASGDFTETLPPTDQWVLYNEKILPPFRIPMWAQQGIYYQIFPDRFLNGDQSNDQDFQEPYYQGRNELPASGKTNGEYFHFVEDWDDVSGLVKSPYRTDGKPDYFSFYGGDIEGVRQKIPYLRDLGITIIYFNPVTDARSNHRYDPCDYLKLDPHLGTEDQFKAFTEECAENGIRVIIDMAFNHTGDCHFAFQDALKKWKESKYFNWYEWKKRPPSYPLPPGEKAIDYYDCWWGFGLHPNLNYDLSRPNAQENGIKDTKDADPNWDVVNYVLKVPAYWMGELGVSGFRLDVPNEVPFWFWRLFREKCREVKPDHVLIGEIWGDARQWIGPEVFDAVMNYRYFKDPVVKWIGQKKGNSATFDQELAGGRTRYPLQAVRAQMNLIDSHDTRRFLRVAGEDARRLRLAATFAMTYVGAPHIYYGDELALTGGKDPDCRRTMPWSTMDAPARQETLRHYQELTRLRREHDALSLGDFIPVLTQGQVYAYLRVEGDDKVLVVLNNGEAPASVVVPVGNARIPDGTSIEFLLGEGEATTVTRGAVKLQVPGVDAVIVALR